jgi:predicted  nucleic acid-binding Zn-ribbon protein
MRTDKSTLALSARITNWLLLGSVAFAVSLCLNLIASHDFGKAFFTGVITIPATYAGAIVIHKRRLNREKRFRNSLINQIQELEAYQEDMNQYLVDALSEEQGLEASINNLKSELNSLRSQVSEGYNQRKSISWELVGLQEQKQQKLHEISTLQEQTNTLKNEINQLNQVASSKNAEIRKAENELNLIKSEVRQLPDKITELETEKQSLEQDLLNIQIQKSILLEEENQARQSLAFFNLELIQLKAKAKPQNEQPANQQELLSLREEKSQLEAEVKRLKRPQKLSKQILNQEPVLSQEWLDFLKQLPDYGIKVIESIAEPSDLIATLKTIAEENLTMPELLIDYINNCAMETIGDRIIEPGSISTPPVIAPEYLALVNQAINFYKS